MKCKNTIAMVLAGAMLLPSNAFAADLSQYKDFPNDWSAKSLEQAIDDGLLNGSNGMIDAKGLLTRAQMAAIVSRSFGAAKTASLDDYRDVLPSAWYYSDMGKAVKMGAFQGANGLLNPDAPITRAEFAAIAARFDDKNTNTTSNFSDIASHWAKDEIGVAANKGWINGYPDSTFRPDQYITRAEAMTLVNRVLNRLPEKSEDLLDDMIKWPDNADASVWYYLAVQEATNSHDYSDKSDADKYEKWTKIRDARDWTLLEK